MVSLSCLQLRESLKRSATSAFLEKLLNGPVCVFSVVRHCSFRDSQSSCTVGNDPYGGLHSLRTGVGVASYPQKPAAVAEPPADPLVTTATSGRMPNPVDTFTSLAAQLAVPERLVVLLDLPEKMVIGGLIS